MRDVTIQWQDGHPFTGIDSIPHRIAIRAPGEGGEPGAKASDLMLLSLGSCPAYDIVSILKKKRQKITALEVRVTAEQLPDPPWTFQRFHLHYIVSGQELDRKAVEDTITLADEKYCSVAATLRLAIPVTHDYEIIDARLEAEK